MARPSLNSRTALCMASACLTGVSCRFDGGSRTDPELLQKFRKGLLIPFCPETLAGMNIPRPRIELFGGGGGEVLNGSARAVTEQGEDVTAQLLEASARIAGLAETVKPAVIYLKSKSPSCGVRTEGKKGITSAMLERYGFNLEERG